ncbi:MAG: ARF-binding protein [Ramalina farinacea]|uniref:ARF-binding protein n=1 Tax=Ramalina farinacea TaxID=258253 RepID=A0AA43QGG9_9LECA|nr:ARF-binding protein [Ramalina farinacea]
MEAASARYARDRFGAFGEPAQTPLQRYIQNAVDPQQSYEPNLGLNLEISDLINSKKGNAPREAAVAIVNYVNHRNPNVSLLSLALLDICVKNCGYPFHLQISTKEFLNELVRRFPERPPLRPARVQLRILELIEEWRQTICQTSRYKEDLGFIRDMHRLLSHKGYVFPEVRREDAAVLNRSENLQSAEEMEEEERAAQSAKLQELIRRGGPEDLQEANRLMKVMAGFDNRHKTDYRAKAAEEVGKIQQKARLLEERLQDFKQGDKMTEGDVFEELASALQSAHPKIQKMCEEESDDAEAVAKLLEINDSIHRTIERYKLVKRGDLEAASKIPRGTLGTSTGVTKTGDNELSLIDFSGDAEPPTSDTAANAAMGQSSGSIEDDLLGLSMQDQNYGQTGGIALGFGANTNVPGPSLLSSSTQENSAAAAPPQATPQRPPAPTLSKPNYDPFASLSSSSHPPSGSTTPANASFLQSQQRAPPPSQPSPDPFASPSFRQPSPLPQQNGPSQPSVSSSLFDFASPAPQTAQPPSQPNQTTNGAATDEDWDFASALPDDGLPPSNQLVVSNTSVNITFKASRIGQSSDAVSLMAQFSNNTPTLITEYTFQVAVTKGLTLKLTPQSGRTLLPSQKDGITQPITINGVQRGQANTIKMRWKASYKVAGELRQEQGEVPPLGIA